MYFANPWGLLGLIAIPVIVAIHLFRRRFAPLPVAGLHLWGVETRVIDSGRRRDRLPITLSLILELLAALLLTLLISDPRWDSKEFRQHLIVVLDDSASMLAAPEGQDSLREQTLDLLAERMQQAGHDARLTLIRTGTQPTLLGTRGMSWDEAKSILQQWKPMAPRHRFEPAWDEAIQLAGTQGRFLFMTDHVPEHREFFPKGMELIALGSPIDNVAFTAARWIIGEGGNADKIFLRIANFGRDSATVQVDGTSAGQKVFSQQIVLDAQAERPWNLSVPSGLPELEIQLLAPRDGLETDNHLRLIRPRRRIVRLSNALPPDSFERRQIERVVSAMPDIKVVDSASADLVIGQGGNLPPMQTEAWWFGLGPLETTKQARDAALSFGGPFLLERQNPLLDGVSLAGVIWGGVQPVDQWRLTPIISVGDTPLLARWEGSQANAWIMNIDLRQSNLTESLDFPILMANLVEERRNTLPGLRRWNYRPGELIRCYIVETSESQDLPIELHGSSGAPRPLVRDRFGLVELPPLMAAGLYEIRQGQTLHGRLTINYFDPEESSLQELSRAHLVPETHYEPVKIRLDNPLSWLIVTAILATIIVMLANWFVLSRRRYGMPTG